MNKSNIYAIADIGSNTVKCDVYEVDENGAVHHIEFMTEKLGLIARIKNGSLTAGAIALLCDTLAGYKKNAEKLGAAVFAVFGTAVLRNISNFAEVDKAVSGRTGKHITLLSGEDEARLSFTGFRFADPEIRKGLMADMGGGSTEIAAFNGNTMHDSHSFPIGCLALYKQFVAGRFPTPNEKKDIYEYVTKEISSYPFTVGHDILTLVGGTGKAIKKLLRHSGSVEAFAPAELLYELAEKFAAPTDKDIALLEELVPARVETVIPGLIAYIAIADRAGAKKITVSSAGLREGCLLEVINRNE